jgi:hypothetical protein
MYCPACAATCGPGARTACDKCGHVFDLDVTGVVPTVGVFDAGETRLTPRKGRGPR